MIEFVERHQRDRAALARRVREWRAVRATARAAGMPSVAAEANARIRDALASACAKPTPAYLIRTARAWHSWAATPQPGDDPALVFERERADVRAHALVRLVRERRTNERERNIDLGVWEMLMGEVTPAEFTARQDARLTAATVARQIAEDAARTGWLRAHTPAARRTLIASLRRTLEREGGLA